MATWLNARRICVRIVESDRIGHQNLAERLVQEAQRHGLAGATVWRGYLSLGGESHLRTSRLLDLSNDLPVLVELVDDAERLEAFEPFLVSLLEQAGCGALLTREELSALRIAHRAEA